MALLGIILGVFCLLFLVYIILRQPPQQPNNKGDTDAK